MVNQAGIYAGPDGFIINVGDATKLVGSVLASDTENNSLKTKNLVMEDIENKAKYSYESRGLSYLNDKSVNKYSDKYNELGLTPNIMPGEKGKADSTTYSSIAKGKLEVENSNIDVNSIRRNTDNSLNKLNEIFDKQSIEERQQTAALLGKYANEAIHRFGEIRDKQGNKKHKDSSAEKVALHALAGAITASITKGNVTSGAVAGGLNEALINEITKLAKDKPDAAQMLSAGLGYAVDKIAGGNGYSGASITQAGTKWNLFGDGHKGKKMTSVAIGIETEGFGHASLIIGFDDDTYEEANFGRYGSNVTRISSTPYASPIGGGTYAFDYNYIPSKDIKRLYFIDVNPNDVAYWYNSTIVNNGYQLINDSIIIRKDRDGKEIVSSASYRNSSNMDYNLFSNNCVTTSLNPILSLTKYNNTTINLLRKVISPPAVENILKNFGKHDKIVKKVINDD